MSASISTVPLPTPAPRREALTVLLRGLKVQAAIGVHAHEHGRLQPLIVDVELDLDDGDVRMLADTLDYEGVAALARSLAGGPHISLVETFAERLALACLDDPRVMRVSVLVEKPTAVAGAAAAGCRVVYRR